MDFDLYRVVTSELRLATLGELKTIRSVKDLRDYIEILEVHQTLEHERYLNEKQANESKR